MEVNEEVDEDPSVFTCDFILGLGHVVVKRPAPMFVIQQQVVDAICVLDHSPRVLDFVVIVRLNPLFDLSAEFRQRLEVLISGCRKVAPLSFARRFLRAQVGHPCRIYTDLLYTPE